jgi:hypothetical protein
MQEMCCGKIPTKQPNCLVLLNWALHYMEIQVATAGKMKFPNPNERSIDSPAVFCPAARVLGLVNQSTGGDAKRISKNVREEFTKQAHEKGWDIVGFLPEVQSEHGAGCLLVKHLAPAAVRGGQPLDLDQQLGLNHIK